jgi:hypothetical protein
MKTAIALATFWALIAPAQAQRWTPEAGSYPYRLEVIEHVGERPDSGGRIDYDLVFDGKGGLVAVVRSAERIEEGVVKPVTVDDACRTTLHAGPGELARVTFAPVTPQAAANLGEDFMPACTPIGLFGPVSEVFRLTMIQLGPEFGLARLAKPGDSHRFPAFASKVDRPAMTIDLQSAGGAMSFASEDKGRATVDWAPDTTSVSVINREAIPGLAVRGEGTARFAMRLVIDRKTGALVSAASTTDRANLVLDIKDAPPIHLAVTRTLKIAPRP